MTLSICLLARNEEHNLGRVLGSVAGLAEEVIVGDVASEDGTARVAAAAGSRVLALAWEDDFALARNAVLDQANGDWILWLNPDEELLPCDRELLRASLERPDVLAYRLHVQEVPRGDCLEAFTVTVQTRLFRRRAEVRFLGRLHPHFHPPLETLAAASGQHLLPLDLVIRRHAYLSELTEPKLRWAAHLLELELRDRPSDLHYLVEYGRVLLRLNDARGHEVLAEAADIVLAGRDAPRPPTATVGLLLEYLLTVAPAHSRSRLSAPEAAELALRWFPTSPPLMWRLAERLFRMADYARAADLLEWLVRAGQTGAYDHSAAFDPSIIGPAALLNLGLCRLRQGDPERAERCFLQVQTSRGYEDRATQGLAEVARLKASRGR